jgi:hypothetical protein
MIHFHFYCGQISSHTSKLSIGLSLNKQELSLKPIYICNVSVKFAWIQQLQQLFLYLGNAQPAFAKLAWPLKKKNLSQTYFSKLYCSLNQWSSFDIIIIYPEEPFRMQVPLYIFFFASKYSFLQLVNGVVSGLTKVLVFCVK